MMFKFLFITLIGFGWLTPAYGVVTCQSIFAEIAISNPFDGIKVIGGSSKIPDSKVVLIADQNHADVVYRKSLVKAINALANPGDILLVEGAASLKPVSRSSAPEFSDLDKGITLLGWDNLPLLRRSLAILKRLFEINSILDRSSRNEAILMNEFTRLSTENDRISYVDRTESLTDAIRVAAERNEGRRIFVLAGASHFSANNHVMNSLQQTPFIILTKESNSTAEQAATYYGH